MWLAAVKGAWGLAKAVPWWVWVVGALALGVWRYGAYQFNTGYDAAMAEVEEARAQNTQEREEETAQVEVRYVDRVKIIREKGDEIVRTVKVPVNVCDIDGSFRVLHDAAARNAVPDPAEVADAAPVPVEDAAATVEDNYTACNVYVEQLNSWITWAEEQCALNKEGCP